MPEIDHTCTSEIVCPHCGYVHRDSWERRDDSDDECECHDCEKRFAWQRYTHVTYNTQKIEDPRHAD